MKKLSLLALLMCSILFVSAQNKPSFSYYSQETLDAIGTSKEQQAQIREVKKNTEATVRSVKNNSSLTEDERKARYKEIYGEGGVLYKKILTKEQDDKLKELFRAFQESNK